MEDTLILKIRQFSSYIHHELTIDMVENVLVDEYAKYKWEYATDRERKIEWECLRSVYRDGCTKEQLTKFISRM